MNTFKTARPNTWLEIIRKLRMPLQKAIAEIEDPLARRCPKCTRTKPLSKFGRSKRDGHQWICRSCAAQKARERYARKKALKQECGP